MPRETLPSGSSLLALAGGGVARATPSKHSRAEGVPPASAPPDPGPRQTLSAGVENENSVERTSRQSAADSRTQKVTARVSAALLEEIRDCVVALSGPPHGMTMVLFAEEAFRRELDRLNRKHSAGNPFPRRPYNSKPGRRIS